MVGRREAKLCGRLRKASDYLWLLIWVILAAMFCMKAVLRLLVRR